MFHFFLFCHTVRCTTHSSYRHQVDGYVAKQNKTLKSSNINRNLHCKNSPVSAMRWSNTLHCVYTSNHAHGTIQWIYKMQRTFSLTISISTVVTELKKPLAKNQQDIQLQKTLAQRVDYVTDKESWNIWHSWHVVNYAFNICSCLPHFSFYVLTFCMKYSTIFPA